MIAFGAAVKALPEGNGRIGGYLIVFGDGEHRDLQGEYFTAKTDFMLEGYPIAGERVLYHHGLDKKLGAKPLARIDVMRTDAVGVWVEAQLDMADAYQQAIEEMVQAGKLGWSSGALPQTVDVDGSGEIKRWAVIEGSLTPRPAQPMATRIVTVKSLLEGEKTVNVLEMAQAFVQQMAETQGRTMTPEELASAAQAVVSALGMAETAGGEVMEAKLEAQPSAVVEAVGKALAAQDAVARGKFEAAMKQFDVKPQSRASAATGASAGVREVVDMRYDHLKTEDLIFGLNMLRESGKPGSESMHRAAYQKAMRDVEYTTTPLGRDGGYIKSHLPIKADEIVATNLAGNGGNWVGIVYNTTLWEAARQPVVYQELISAGMLEYTVPQGANSMYIPTEGTDPVWSTLTELNDWVAADERLPITPRATPSIAPGRVQVTPAFVGARVMYSFIMEEDSIIPVLPFLRSRMEISAQENIEYMIMNGDTATAANTNLNLIDGTPSVDSKGRGPAYLAFNGLLKLPTITTVAQSRNANAAISEDDYLATFNLLPDTQASEEKCVFVVDVRTMVATRNIPAFKTRDVYSNATLEGGRIQSIFGVRTLVSNQVKLANLNGRISATPANNNRGRILCVRPDRWAVVTKRDVTTEVARDIDAQASVIVSTLRMSLVNVSNTGSAAATFNLVV
jgi:hypothetical protein